MSSNAPVNIAADSAGFLRNLASSIKRKARFCRINTIAAIASVAFLGLQPASLADVHNSIILTVKFDDLIREFSEDSLKKFDSKLIDDTTPDVSILTKALDNYAVEIAASDFLQYDAILAMKMNGQKLTRRDKGPIWIVYPSLEHPKFNEEGNHFKWVWQLFELEVIQN